VTLHGRVDALVFAGGIGERSDALRAAVVEQVGCLGFELDEEGNSNSRVEGEGEGVVVVDVGKKSEAGEADSELGRPRPRVLVCRTDEQFEMARGCAEDAEFW
jgi:acetate kinase